MNDEGRKYIENINKKFNRLPQEVKEGFNHQKINWQHHLFQERLMRIGREYRLFELVDPRDADTQKVVIATLKEDLVNRYGEKEMEKVK